MTDQAAAVVGSAAAGAGAAALSFLGIEPAPLFWALVGATLGMTFAAVMSRVRAGVVFVAVVLSCSLFGAFIAQRYLGGEPITRNACACALAIFFHPIVSLALTKLPALWDALQARWVGSTGEPKP